MVHQGNLLKMTTQLKASKVDYRLPVGSESVALNPYIGKPLQIKYTGQIHCIACGRKTKKSFNQGYCFPCMRTLAECDMCIVRPEQCHFDQGTCRDEQWAEGHCLQEHIVYLANSSGMKVGITRHTQIPTRWIDQGAVQAIPIYRVSNRHVSGLVEVIIKNHISDRTDWRKMLKGDPEPMDMVAQRNKIDALVSKELEDLSKKNGQTIQRLQDEPVSINYPVLAYPEKVKSLNFDKTPQIGGVLQGIKGQYLIFDSGVINIRKFTGYQVGLVSELESVS